jgi:REP element-mobilizing transposase RayT
MWGGAGMKGDRFYKTWGKSRSVRLNGFDYDAGGVIYHVIIGSDRKRCGFVEREINGPVIEILKRACSIHGYKLLACCLMPDHLHLLAQAFEGSTDLPGLIRAVKSFSTRSIGHALWQRGYYEHIMRSYEDVKRTAEYIVNNPVRKGLVRRAEQYPWGAVVGKW